MQKIMILGASILQLPAILKAKEMGLYVIAADKNKNAVGFKHADLCLEISTTDIASIVKAAGKCEINGIMTIATDMPVCTVAAVAQKYHLPGVSQETAAKATNKAIMRECLMKNNVPIPAFYRISDYDKYMSIARSFTERLIVKPADSSGSRGVFLVQNIHNEKDLTEAFDYSKKYSTSGEIVVEEFMMGEEVSVEALSVHGKVNVIAITDKLTTGAPKFVEMGHSQPSRLLSKTQARIVEVALRAVTAIGIENGPSHTEIIVTNNGPKIVELGARLGGDNITTHLVPLSTGVDMVKNSIEIALGQMPDLSKKFSKGAAIRYFETSVGQIMSIDGVMEAKAMDGVRQISFIKGLGEFANAISNSSDRIGFIIAQADTAEKAIEKCEMAMNRIKIGVKS